MFKRLLLALATLVLLAGTALAAVIAFDSPARPPVLKAGNAIPGIAEWNFATLPERRSVKARDDAPLHYRLYPGQSDRVIVLVHGSTGTGVEMHKLAQALQAAGASVYAISLRGHGGSGTTNGDVSYLGQLDDDLVDLTQALGLDKLGIRRTLAGFSSGGGFVLRIAGGGLAGLFDDYLAISPYIAADSPTGSRDAGGWAGVALPRITALSLLHAIGLPWFQGLPAVAFATAAKADESRTPVYSFRLMANLQLGRNWRSVLAHISAPTRIVIGAQDELFAADQFEPLLQAINPRIDLTLVSDAGHLAMIGDPQAIAAVVGAWQKLGGR
jgi:pimeloyl-ACP methyl ester carboxylesterase